MMTSTTSGSDPAPGAGPATRTNHTPGSVPGVGATGTAVVGGREGLACRLDSPVFMHTPPPVVSCQRL